MFSSNEAGIICRPPSMLHLYRYVFAFVSIYLFETISFLILINYKSDERFKELKHLCFWRAQIFHVLWTFLLLFELKKNRNKQTIRKHSDVATGGQEGESALGHFRGSLK